MTRAAKSCLCGHSGAAHEHYHRGAVCALCGGCTHYRPAGRISTYLDGLWHSAAGHQDAAVASLAAPADRPHLYLVS